MSTFVRSTLDGSSSCKGGGCGPVEVVAVDETEARGEECDGLGGPGGVVGAVKDEAPEASWYMMMPWED